MLFAVFCVCCAFGLSHAFGDTFTNTDLDTVRDRLKNQILVVGAGNCPDLRHCEHGPPDLVAAHRDAEALTSYGAWLDVNYSDKTRTGSWSPHMHLDRSGE